jgi:hypothetical protein
MSTMEFTEDRRERIIRLIEILDQGLPEPSRHDSSSSGFVNEQRARTCPDCLANGRVMFGCETCGGSGEVPGGRVETAVSVPDALDTDGLRIDPYAQQSWLEQPFGVASTGKLGHAPTRDREIERMRAQLREPWQSSADELDDANRNPYPWERERRDRERRFDLDALRSALDDLRASTEPGLAGLVVSVFGARFCEHGVPPGDACRPCGKVIERAGLIEISSTFEAGVDRALRFVSDRMPDPIRAPGAAEHPAAARQRRRAA